ncbi:voltage-dependent T-type calcium channel subunit alpha-1H isoform X4 [Cimex lectularius]|uniref:Ion transport domain-containing protein n=1 Tax=Cimex lectularius TaxID=79782 RepID=A0A8I6SKN4_CIMLE|nr:voltage-dependent T-type calcium channel subunit alpha-1H isoform X4 [Cimex lectularius]
MMVILLNCVTLGMYQPCVVKCESNRCQILQLFDDFIFAFFALEMSIKMIAMGVYGKGTYLADSWNRLDFFIVLAGALEYALNVDNMNLSAIRTIRVLRPLRAINRIPSMRILVMLLLDTLPMLGNVLLLCFFVFFIFGIVGVQLWEGILRQRCFLKPIPNVTYPKGLPQEYSVRVRTTEQLAAYYFHQEQERDYICSRPEDSGMHRCEDIPPTKFGNITCSGIALPWSPNIPNNKSCVNWNQYYTECKPQGLNPFQGTISFDNIGLAWVAIFLVISLEGWSDIMYYVQDAHSFWDWIYFVLLIVIGSFFMINLCLVVIATQFSETKKREMERMRLERARFQSSSTLASSTNNSEPTSCYTEIVKYLAHLFRRGKRRLIKKYRLWKYRRQQRREKKKENPVQPLANTILLKPFPPSSQSPQGPARKKDEEVPAEAEDGLSPKKSSLLRVPSFNGGGSSNWEQSNEGNLLSPGNSPQRRRSSVMFSEVVLLHGGTQSETPVMSEKITQAGDGSLRPPNQQGGTTTEAMTCQELLALSGALSAALPTGQIALDSLFTSLSKGVLQSHFTWADTELALKPTENQRRKEPGCLMKGCLCFRYCFLAGIRRAIKSLVEHKYFQQGILLAILINTLSMGIEHHNQPEQLTLIVETSNIVFSSIFALEMLFKVIAEGPFGYISNGFNVFDGVIVILSVIELIQTFLGEGEGSSGLSVLRTFRLLRILKLVRFMPNLRRQLFVMLRTMDNVAVFFSLLILFIFIFSILGMYLFGGKFCTLADGSRECNCKEILAKRPDCVCDRKHFNTMLWATVTVFQILTQEDWNVVLFNGMEKTSHWAALYFVALMTFGNYVLFNLLVAILVEGFSSERHERREREQRELAKKQMALHRKYSECFSEDVYSSCSLSEQDSYMQQEARSEREEYNRRLKENGHKDKENSWKLKSSQNKEDFNLKCNIQKDDVSESQMLTQAPIITHTAATPQDSPNATLDGSARDFNNRLSSSMALQFYSSSLSIDSIDCSMSSQVSIPGMLKPPTLTVNNLTAPHQHFRRRASVNNGASRKDPSQTSLFQRRCSWKMSRSSLRRKSRSGSEPDEEQNIVLNNNNHLIASPIQSELIHCNGNLIETIRNDTQSSKNSSIIKLSPQTSIRSQNSNNSEQQCAQVSWVASGGLSRQNSIGGASVCSNQNSQNLTPTVTQPISSQHLKVTTTNNSNLSIPQRIEDCKSINISAGACGLRQPSPLPKVKETPPIEESTSEPSVPPVPKVFFFFKQEGCFVEREDYALYIFPPDNSFRLMCKTFVEQKWFDNVVLFFIALNCITLAMERPNIPPYSKERLFLATANYVFTAVFSLEMFVKVVATGMFYSRDAYFTSGWNVMDGLLVLISIIDLLMSVISESSPRIFGILRVFRLLRSLRPLRVINRAPGLKLVVQTLLSSLKPIGNIVLICCTFFIIFGILGVQMFKGTFFYCDGPNIKNVKNKSDCYAAHKQNRWLNRKYNFDDLGKALMSLFVLSSRDGWVNIMYTGLDAVGVDQQPQENYSEWRLLYFIAFILLVGFFVLNMFVGVVVENFHRCREEQEKEERVRRMAKRAKQMEKKRKRMHQPPYYTNYSKSRLFVHNVVTSKYFDLAIAAVIGLNVITMAMEFYMMPKELTYALKIFNYFFTAVFILESIMKLVALGVKLYMKDKWNQLDVLIVILSIVGIVLEEMESNIIPINPTIIRVMRVMRIARVLKLLKMAKGIRALLDTVMQALPQVGNLGLLFFLLFFIFAALGVELFGRLECSTEHPCQGLGEHAHFSNFGMAFLTLFRVATGDNWNGIMKDTLRTDCDDKPDCVKNCCVSGIAPIFFVIFVLMAQFVLVNVVVAVLMKHLEESHKQDAMDKYLNELAKQNGEEGVWFTKETATHQELTELLEDELDIEDELERELAAEQLEDEEEDLCLQLALEQDAIHRPLAKVLSLPANFTFSSDSRDSNSPNNSRQRRASSNSWRDVRDNAIAKNSRRRQTLQGPMLIPPAYPTVGYTSIYTTHHDRERIRVTKQQSIADDENPITLSVPTHSGRLMSLPESCPPEILTEPATTEFIRESPESLSPGVILIPPPYSDAESPSENVIGSDSRQEKLQVSPGGQRVRIRLCDTRMDSGIGDEKHSQESQPSSGNPYERETPEKSIDQVIVHNQRVS